MKYVCFLLMLMLGSALLNSCEVDSSDNGDLDGFWHFRIIYESVYVAPQIPLSITCFVPLCCFDEIRTFKVKPITIMRNFQLFTISVIFLRILHLYLKLLLYFCKCIYLFYIYSMAKKDVNRLKIMLAVTKHSNKWLAEMLGKDQATISKWCTNTCQPDLETLIRISDLLKVDVNDLLNKECIKE